MAMIFLPGIEEAELVDSHPVDWPRRGSLEDITVGDIIENSLDFTLVDERHDTADGHGMRPTRRYRKSPKETLILPRGRSVTVPAERSPCPSN